MVFHLLFFAAFEIESCCLFLIPCFDVHMKRGPLICIRFPRVFVIFYLSTHSGIQHDLHIQ